jgi:ABC-type glycerol-3-phosphate transport system permease component
MSRDRVWALRWSYFFLVVFAIFSLTPPFYMLITSLKSSAEISAATNPWWVFHPTLSNYAELLGSNMYLRFFWNSAMVSVLPVGIITSLVKGDVFNWGQIMTGALLGAAPPLIIYAFLMDYYIAGLTAGAMKG